MSVSLPENAQIEKLLLSLPFFGGVPYISTRVVPALYHITLLPQHWIWEELTSLARYQVAANRLPVCLVLANDRCVYYTADGQESASDRPPRGGALVADFLRLCVDLPVTPELAERSDLLHAIIARQSQQGGYLLGDLRKCGRRATEAEQSMLRCTTASGVPTGLARCSKCGDWRGECLDPSPRLEDWVVPVSCRCDNHNRCAWCGGPLYERRLNGNYLEPGDGQIWHVPGFLGFRHNCQIHDG